MVDTTLGRKGERIVVLDVSESCSFADVFVIASGSSDRHVRAVVDAIEHSLSDAGERPLAIEGYREGRWVLIDANDVIVHVFQEEVRRHYDCERLWSDVPALHFRGLPSQQLAR